MRKNINYLGFLSLLSLIGLFGIFQRDSLNLLSFFGFIGYIGYFKVKPDELFKIRVYQTSAYTLVITLLLMLIFFVGYIITNNIDFFMHGFWISFTVMIITFPIIFVWSEWKEIKESK